MPIAVAVASMVLVGIRPRGIPEWLWPAAGALLLVALGAEPAPAALLAVLAQWNVLLFILGLMGIAAGAEASGLFDWVAETLLARAGGSRRRLFVAIFLAGAALTIVLSNDATAIVFTPVVLHALETRKIDALPYLYACTFVADTASFGLPFSNPANLLIVPHPHLTAFVLHLGVPMLIAVGLNLTIFLGWFRRDLRASYPVETPKPIAPRARRTMIAAIAVAAAYAGALAADWPLGPVALVGSAVVLAAAGIGPRAASARIGWATFALLAGTFVLLDAVARAGIVAWAIAALRDAAHDGAFATILAAAFGSALVSNFLNNLPVAVVSGAIAARDATSALAYPLIAGVDIGPNLATTGSLATILWLSILHRRNVEVSPLEYLRLGLAVVPAILLPTSLWLYLLR